MSTKTEHLGLHQWEPEDSFLRSDFNEDFAKIDAGVKAAAELPYAVGTFTAGSGSETVTVELGFTPSAVLVGGTLGVFSNSGSSNTAVFNSQGFAVRGEPSHYVGYSCEIKSETVTIVEGGFQVTLLTDRANPYRYIAFR